MDPLEHHLLGQLDQHEISFWHRVRARAVLDVLPERGPATLADVGAGAGVLGEIVLSQRPTVTYRFREPIPSLAENLASRFGAEARLADLADLDTADVVAMLDVIEHVEDDRGLLADVVGPMRPGSILVVTVPALPALWSDWDRRLGHHRRYTRSRLRSAVAGLSLDVLDISYLFPEMIPPALIRRYQRRAIDDPSSSELPDLPSWLERLLFAVSSATYRFRRLWPAGSSLVLVARRRSQ